MKKFEKMSLEEIYSAKDVWLAKTKGKLTVPCFYCEKLFSRKIIGYRKMYCSSECSKQLCRIRNRLNMQAKTSNMRYTHRLDMSKPMSEWRFEKIEA